MMTKADTRLLLVDDLSVDASQWATDLTSSGSGSYEEASARTAIDGTEGRTIELVFEARATSSGVLLDHGNDAAFRLSLSGGVLTVSQNATTLITVNMPSIDTDPRTFAVCWASEVVGDISMSGVRSEITVSNASTGDIQRAVLQHGPATADPADDLSIGGVWSGVSLGSAYTDTISTVRISSRYHTSIEFREDFVTETTPLDVDTWVVAELPRLPERLLEVGELAGPQYIVATAAGTQHRPRLASPLVQALARSTPEIGENLEETYPATWVIDLGDGWQATAAWLWRLDVPRFCGWVIATVQLAVWNTNTDPPATVEIAIATSDRRPGAGGQVSRTSITRSADDGDNGLGALLELPRCFVVRDGDGFTWCWLMMRITGDNASGTAYRIRQCTIVPASVPALEQPEEPDDIFSP